jgi:hypothetical protein
MPPGWDGSIRRYVSYSRDLTSSILVPSMSAPHVDHRVPDMVR